MLTLLLYWYLETASATKPPKDCASRLTLAADNSRRFLDPPVERYFPLEQTQSMFLDLNAGQMGTSPVITSFEFKVARWLRLRHGFRRVAVTVRLFAAASEEELTPEFIKFAARKKTLDAVTDASLVLELSNPDHMLLVQGTATPASVNNDPFAEALIPRHVLQAILNSAAANIPGTHILDQNRISAWGSDDHRTQLFVDVTRLSHAEFAVVLNALVGWMSERAKD